MAFSSSRSVWPEDGVRPLTVAKTGLCAPDKVWDAVTYDHEKASGQDFVRVVFRTAEDLPRRADGAIQAGVSIDGLSHSIGAVQKGAPIYTGAAEVKGHSITALNGKDIRKGAKVGRSFTVRFFTRDGQRVTKRMTLRAERTGDDAGTPLSRWSQPREPARRLDGPVRAQYRLRLVCGG